MLSFNVMNRFELKENAKRALKGKYKDAIIIISLMSLISFAASFVGAFLGIFGPIVSIVINGLAFVGYTSFFLKISRGENPSYKELFERTDLLVPYILISILTTVFTLLWSILFIIPGIIAAISYSMVYYIALDNPELSAKEAIGKSVEMMRGYKLEYFMLQLSFFGWALLVPFTFGLLSLWLIPYMQVTSANFYNKLKEIK